MKTRKTLDPNLFGLSSRVNLKQDEDGTITIIKDRKSRIIMKDGFKLNEQANAIRNVAPGSNIVVLTTAPVCSKTRDYLHENGIHVKTI